MPVILSCPRCGQTFKRKPSYVAKATGTKLYCSDACRKWSPPAEVLKHKYEVELLSAEQIAKEYGTTRMVTQRWLRNAGIKMRSTAEAKRAELSHYSYEKRLQMTEASRRVINRHETKPHAWLVARAKGVQAKARLSKHEQTFLEAFTDRGIRVVPQYAVDIYNIDFAIPELMIAIEVDGGNWHKSSPKKEQDEAIRLLAAYAVPEAPAAAVVPRAGIGYGCSEAPRGILWHRYAVDAQGRILSARIVPPTSQNQARIEEDLHSSLRVFGLHHSDTALRSHCEKVIRNYDPCISCATHFLQMQVERI